MSAIFISYTGRDPEGDAWADRLVEWFEEWNYGFYRDKDHSHGIKAGEEWRPALYRSLASAQVMVCLCSKQYENSAWCVGEMAIAHRDGKSVIPIHLARTASGFKSNPLPSMLQTQQAIKITSALKPTAAQLKEAKQRLQHRLKETLKWRELLDWDVNQQPYPGLLSFTAQQAPVFYGQDAAIKTLREELAGLAQRAPAALVVLGASGTGKSSLVRAGVVPRLAAEPERWLLLEPFRPGRFPFEQLKQDLGPALAALPERLPAVKREKQEAALQRQLDWLSAKGKRPVVMVIDQLEELLVDDNTEATEFLDFVERLLQRELCGVVVLATLRTDFLALLEARRPVLTGLMQPTTPEAIQPQRFGELISGPAMRAQLKLQPGLAEELVAESKGSDALPLLAYTLEKLWQRRQERGTRVKVADGSLVDITLDDLKAVGGVAGAVSHQASLCWNPLTTSEADTRELQQAFVHHLVRLNDEGLATKQPARWDALPPASRPLLKRFVEARLLVSGGGEAGELVEIAHEALLRTWEPLEKWIEEDKSKLALRLLVEKLGRDISLSNPQTVRMGAFMYLSVLSSTNPDVPAIAFNSLAECLTEEQRTPDEWSAAAELLALAGPHSLEILYQFMERAQLHTPQPMQSASATLRALSRASASITKIYQQKKQLLTASPRYLVVPSAKSSYNKREHSVSTEATRIRLADFPPVSDELAAWLQPLDEATSIVMIQVPSGSFIMGNTNENEHTRPNEFPGHSVKLRKFSISQSPITQEQWEIVARLGAANPNSSHRTLDAKPSRFSEIYRTDNAKNRPVESISWQAAVEFCKILSSISGREYFLPSESQWEYCCNSGMPLPFDFSFGNVLSCELANYDSNTPYSDYPLGSIVGRTTETGLYPGNRWGLLDMHGNVSEWCADDWHDSYEGGAPLDGSAWIDNGEPEFRLKVVRGGSWRSRARECRIKSRDSERLGYLAKPDTIGFRVVCSTI